MECYKEYLQSVVSGYWGESSFRWLFYISLLIVFFIEKDKEKRRIIFWYPLVAYLFMISPVWHYIGAKAWGTDSLGYYFRQFSLVPIFITIAVALTLLIKSFSPVVKVISVVLICGIIIRCGSGLMYKHESYGFERSENIYKIPSDLMEICDYMDGVDSDPVVVMSADLSALARQYDASLHLKVEAREYVNRLSWELLADSPDVAYLMERCCSEGADYIVAKNLDSVRGCFLNHGYIPCYETNKYLLYECSGYPGEKIIFDERDRVVN